MYPEFDGYVTFYKGINKIKEVGPIPCTYHREALMHALITFKEKNFNRIKIRLE